MKIYISCAVIALNSASAEMTEPVTEPKFVEFFEWLKQEGAVFDGIELRKESEFMRGVYATRSFK